MQQSSQKRYTSLVSSSKKEINLSVAIAKRDIENILRECIAGHGSFLIRDKMSRACPVDFLRALSEWSRNNSLDVAIRNIIISSLFSSEVKQGGSAIISAMMLTDEVEVVEKKTSCSERDVEDIISDWSSPGISRKIAKEVFYMGASGSEVEISESDSFSSRIRCSSGVSQMASIPAGFSDKNLSDISIPRFCHVVAIDGFIEKVSQIHHLLDKIEDQHLILMARGFLPDVISTLSVNYPDRLKCIPVLVTSWCVEDFLHLEEMGVSCISSEAGMEISSSKLSSPISLCVDKDGIVIEQSSSRRKRKIFVDVGRDLGNLKGLTIDRIKTLVTLSRFTSRKGMTKIKYKDHEMHVPTSSYEAAIRCKKSMEKIFQEVGGIVAIHNSGEKCEKH